MSTKKAKSGDRIHFYHKGRKLEYVQVPLDLKEWKVGLVEKKGIRLLTFNMN